MREQRRGMITEVGTLILRASRRKGFVHGESICMQYYNYGGQILYLTIL